MGMGMGSGVGSGDAVPRALLQTEAAEAARPTLQEAQLPLHPGQDHFAEPPLAAKCCSNQSSLARCQSLGNGGEVCWDPGKALG